MHVSLIKFSLSYVFRVMVLKMYQRTISTAEVIHGDFDGKQAMAAAVH